MTAAGISLVWLAVAVGASIALPFNFPYQARDEVIDTAVIVVLLIPLVLSARVLDERPAFAVLTSPRRLRVDRLAAAVLFIGQALLGSLLVTAIAPVPASLVIADCLVLTALLMLGFSIFGPARGWLPAALVVAAASTPGLVPAALNFIYVTELAPTTRWAALIGLAVAITYYARVGAQARSSDENLW